MFCWSNTKNVIRILAWDADDKVKGKTFRISSMGDENEAAMAEIYAKLDKAMAGL